MMILKMKKKILIYFIFKKDNVIIYTVKDMKMAWYFIKNIITKLWNQ